MAEVNIDWSVDVSFKQKEIRKSDNLLIIKHLPKVTIKINPKIHQSKTHLNKIKNELNTISRID